MALRPHETWRFLLDVEAPHDVPRNTQDVALIGDPRNDENVIVSQIHHLFLRFHNAILDGGIASTFEEAQTLVRWHYQWIVLNEYLRLICGDDAVDAALARPTDYALADEFAMPVEFAVAAFRFGHSQVRERYRLHATRAAAIFPSAADAQDPDFRCPPAVRDDLRGGVRLHPDMAVDMQLFFGPDAQPSRKIDTKLVAQLLQLPTTVVPRDPNADPNNDPDRSLAVRNLKRGIAFGLPSGEAIAAYYGIQPLSREQVGDIRGGEGGTPLFFYVLREAEIAGGARLDGVGARLVAETFVDILKMDPASFLASAPEWKPTLEREQHGKFTMMDVVNLVRDAAPIPSQPPPECPDPAEP